LKIVDWPMRMELLGIKTDSFDLKDLVEEAFWFLIKWGEYCKVARPVGHRNCMEVPCQFEGFFTRLWLSKTEQESSWWNLCGMCKYSKNFTLNEKGVDKTDLGREIQIFLETLNQNRDFESFSILSLGGLRRAEKKPAEFNSREGLLDLKTKFWEKQPVLLHGVRFGKRKSTQLISSVWVSGSQVLLLLRKSIWHQMSAD